MITRINSRLYLIVEHASQMKSDITINVNLSAKI